MYVYFNCSQTKLNGGKNKSTVKHSENIAEKYTKYDHSKTINTVLTGLLLAESIGYEGLILFSPVRNTRKF